QLMELVNSEKNDFKDMALAELFRVKKFYTSISRFLDANVSYKDTEGNIIKDEQVPTNILIECLLRDNEWKMRARAAACLRTKKEKGVINALAESIKNDKNLDVLRESINSFEILTGYINPDVLDGRPAIQWWEKNKSELQLNSN
ncbi:MAG: HEAT repeat domain-containing protein, partial [Atribacterota bacterium]|nr:HEAT repeat domain-containing protein [Atribacterota bacterium]